MDDQTAILFYQLVDHIQYDRNAEAKSMLNRELARASNDYGTLLHYTARYDNAVITRELLELGADIDGLGEENQTPLMVAVDNEQQSVVEVLLEANADICKIQNDLGDTALSMALDMVIHYQNEIAQTFVRALRAKYSTTEELGEALISMGCDMHNAAYFDFDVMKYMQKRGVDINSCYGGKMTTLDVALDLGNLNVIAWLIDNGVDVNNVDESGRTVLSNATLFCDKNVVKILLEKGADPNCIGPVHHMDTPLYSVLTRFSFGNRRREMDDEVFECAKLLLQYGAVPYGYCAFTNRTMLDHAFDWPTDKGVKLFISHVAVPEMLDAPIAQLTKYCNREKNRLKISGFANFYEQCLRTSKTAIFERVTMLDLLKASEYTMRLLARDQTFVSKFKGIDSVSEHGELHAFYLKKVIKRVEYGSDMVKMEDEAIPVICRMFNNNYNLCYTIARSVVSYLDERDFQQLIQV